ncbi:two-component system sensor histidine kinase NtrB [Desulfatitalea tepidiphila]|uniref:two-component system sensor histidine kinase NtrB n=1 Tax=Desulfatitalea tepidiphila TaxID=1185843 RepID=UPI00128F46EA|nr:ATP-binding protein [Desulfatitalea tepidiphila]
MVQFQSANSPSKAISVHIHPKLRWLMLARVLFTALLLGATIIFQSRLGSTTNPLVGLIYVLIAAIFVLSLIYAALFPKITRHELFAFIQIAIDSFIVSLIVLITGGFFSLFTFLYLVVIIYASMILYLRGGLLIAIFSSIQYAALVIAQFTEVAPCLAAVADGSPGRLDGLYVTYKILITTAAGFAVAVLSGMLTEQNRKTQKELTTMEAHLKRVEKMAYMGEMAAGLAHEIKNPLASLVGSIQILKEDLRYNPDHERLMDIVLRETDRLGTLVNDFLFFARPPAGKPEILDLEEAICDIVQLFEKDTHHARHVEIKQTLSPGIRVLMDSAHLRQIIWNLLLNAAEAVSEDGRIEIHAVAIKNNEVSVHVIDNGCGIADNVIQTIFDPFFTTKSEGTGLGLSIVHRILEAYDSRLQVQSELGKGTTFSFTLKRSGKVH